MALYAFDGTGNTDHEDDLRDSNVLAFFQAYDDPRKNANPDDDLGSLYLKGIGRAAKTKVGMGVAEAFGIGGHRRVEQAMARLKRNRRNGDSTVDVVGFSRGAAIAISFANDVAEELPDQRIRFIGVFDVVGQFGLPGTRVNAGHELSLPDNVDCCRHAMAMDESRALFPLTRLCNDDGVAAKSLVELWFRGVHSDVGGGNRNRGMNWIALNWMFTQAVRCGLPLAGTAIAANLANQTLAQTISDHKLDLEKRRRFLSTDCLHASVQLVDGAPGRPHNNPKIALRRFDDEGNVVAA